LSDDNSSASTVLAIKKNGSGVGTLTKVEVIKQVSGSGGITAPASNKSEGQKPTTDSSSQKNKGSILPKLSKFRPKLSPKFRKMIPKSKISNEQHLQKIDEEMRTRDEDKDKAEKEAKEKAEREARAKADAASGGKKSRKSRKTRKSRKIRKSRKPKKSRKSRKSRKPKKSRKVRKLRKGKKSYKKH